MEDSFEKWWETEQIAVIFKSARGQTLKDLCEAAYNTGHTHATLMATAALRSLTLK